MPACTGARTRAHTHTNTHFPLLPTGQMLLSPVYSHFLSFIPANNPPIYMVLTAICMQISFPKLYFQLLVLTSSFCIQNELMIFFPSLPVWPLLKHSSYSNISPLPRVVTAPLLISYSPSQSLSLYCAFQDEDHVCNGQSHHPWRACQALCKMTYMLHTAVNLATITILGNRHVLASCFNQRGNFEK